MRRYESTPQKCSTIQMILYTLPIPWLPTLTPGYSGRTKAIKNLKHARTCNCTSRHSVKLRQSRMDPTFTRRAQNMLDANRGISNSALADSTSIEQSIRLREIMTGGLTAAFQSVYPVGERTPFAVEGVVRGPTGSAFERPDLLFQASQDTGLI